VQRPVSGRCKTRLALSTLAALVLAWPAAAAPKVRVTLQTNIRIKISPITATAVPGTDPETLTILARPKAPGETRFELNWPEADTVSVLRLRATQDQPPGGEGAAVMLEAELTLPDGRKVRAPRRIEFDGRTWSLFEIYKEGDKALTLALDVEAEEETLVERRISVGAPVGFLVEIQRVEAGRAITLETDHLQSFVGESVSYSFTLGTTPESDSVRLTLTPLRISGELLEVEVDTSGTLPAPDGPLLLARREKLIASRGAISSLSFESGEPPTGYRFLVTARF
jgi:hypothetical protein